MFVENPGLKAIKQVSVLGSLLGGKGAFVWTGVDLFSVDKLFASQVAGHGDIIALFFKVDKAIMTLLAPFENNFANRCYDMVPVVIFEEVLRSRVL